MGNRRRRSFLVIGLGVFGRSVALELAKMGCEVYAVDKDPKVVQELKDEIEHVGIVDATDGEALQALDVSSFDVCVVGHGSNLGDSILIVDNLKRLGAKCVVAKALNDKQAEILRRVGADQVVIPERDSGTRLAHMLTSPRVKVRDFVELGDNVGLEEIEAPPEFVGRTLADLDLRRRQGVTVLAIKRGKEVIANPDGTTKVEEGDTLVVLGDVEDLERLGGG
ncbi:MAG TPA: TrkA family potassium uptake protein [Armatimonadetes bacterium]|nr:TrkA family potassium uptake protein [Armatimonadota bacterium]